MFRHTGCHGKNIGVKNDIFCGNGGFFRKKFIHAFADFHTAFNCVRLPFFIKSHSKYGCSVFAGFTGFGKKRFFALFETYGINDTFTLHTLQPFADYFPSGGVKHDRHFGDIGVGTEIEEKSFHYLL